MKTIVLAILVASAAAFVPAKEVTQQTNLWAAKQPAKPTAKGASKVAPKGSAKATPRKAAAAVSKTPKPFENELGAQEPLGFFDPLGLVADGDQLKFDRYRFCEIKHGRAAMLAVVGYLVTEAGNRLPGTIDYAGLKFADIPSGLAALEVMPKAGIWQIVLFIGFLDTAVMKDIVGGEFIGDFRNDAIDFGWDTFSDEEKYKQRARELNNGRAAMMGILALVVHELLGVSITPWLNN